MHGRIVLKHLSGSTTLAGCPALPVWPWEGGCVGIGRQVILVKTVMSECTALLGWKSGVRGVLDSGFSSCAVPTYYCRSEYFYSQCSQVQNLIITEHSLNRHEHRIKNKAS